ncbi:MAG: OmpA family protein [Flavobacteriales bacterium]|nr:OmpA family protein [Flavobacteriales bacterium]
MKRQRFVMIVLFWIGITKLILVNAGVEDPYKIKLAGFNSKGSDYSPTYYEGELLYVSNNKVNSFINRYDKLNGGKMYDIVYHGENKTILSLLEKINSKYNEGPIAVINDGKMVFFTRNNSKKKKVIVGSKGKVNLQIYYVILLSEGYWSEPIAVPFNSPDYSVGHPSFSADEKTMYFSSNMPGSMGSSDIYQVSLSGRKWGNPQNLGAVVNSEATEMFPHISVRGELYYSSNKKGGIGGLDIYKAEQKNGTFVKEVNLGEPLNSEQDDFGIISMINDSGKELGFLSSNRTGGVGSDDIYEWESKQKLLFVKGKLYTKGNGTPIADAVINMTDTDGNTIKVKTDQEGNYGVYKLKKGERYSVEIDSPQVFDKKREFTIDFESTEIEIIEDLEVLEWPYLYGEIVDELERPIAGVSYTVKKDGKEVYSSETNEDGVVKYVLPPNAKKGDLLAYTIEYKKDNYLVSNKTVNQYLRKGGGNIINKGKLMTLIENKVGVDVANALDLKPIIYYDYNKADITSESAIELDKIVKLLKDNPSVFIELAAHTDSRGSSRYNLKLSDKRAKIAARYVKEQIDNPSRIYGKGYGESRLKNNCRNKIDCTEEQHAENRRTEFRIVKNIKK